MVLMIAALLVAGAGASHAGDCKEVRRDWTGEVVPCQPRDIGALDRRLPPMVRADEMDYGCDATADLRQREICIDRISRSFLERPSGQ
jgi:hypothetical protein